MNILATRNSKPHTHDLKAEGARPDGRPVAWYTLNGWTYISVEEAKRRQAEHAARFTAQANATVEARLAAKAPTRWPRKHRPLLDELRRLARDLGHSWSWNDRKTDLDGFKAGALIVRGPGGGETEYDSLDEAAADLVAGDAGAAKRTGKAELVRFLKAVVDSLPDQHRVEATRLLEAA